MASSEKATNSMQHVQVKTKSKHRTLGWLTIRRPRSKNKYVLQDAEPHNGHHPDISGRTKTDEELEEDVPTLLERLKIAESARMDTHSLVTLQRHLIDVLRRENGALRLLRLQVDQLKKENGELKGELQKHQPINGLTNGDNGTNNHKTVESLEEELALLRTENEKLRKAKDNDKSNGKESSKGKKSTTKSNVQQKTNGTTLTNGLTNGYHSSQSEEEDDSSNHLPPRLGNGITTNGSSAPKDQTVEDHSPPPSAAAVVVVSQRPALVDGNDVGAGTSGTSLVTVTCLIRTLGNFLDCDEILQERMKAHMAAKGVDLRLKQWVSSEDHNMLTIVLCRSGSDNVRDIENAMEGISSDAEVVLVVLHLASADAKRKDPQTESLGVPAIANVCLVVDMFFSKRDGLYRCEQNDRAMGRLYRLFEMLC
ncbi:uncharacterized protein [Amphiura filiformis]|uniref:uncharacterized protein n=1 Tax=Amphiura filiformis TaxID=82378 RepID=UPI003B21488E